MSEIEYPVERMREAAARIKSAAEEMMQEVADRLNRADYSASSFRAANLSAAYQDFLNAWRQQVTSLAQAWQDLATHLETAAEAVQSADQGLAAAANEEIIAVTPHN